MNNLKDKMYNYEVAPPSQCWQTIATALDKENNCNIQSRQKSNKRFSYSFAAAAVTILIFSLFIRFTDLTPKTNETVIAQPLKKDLRVTVDKITAPGTNEDKDNLANKTGQDNYSRQLNGKGSETTQKYMIISGPQGQPVKISTKAASLIISSDDQHPPNPVWNDKVKRWKDIMKANILAPTTANFLDIVDLTNTIKISN